MAITGEENFFKPILSTFGLIISFIAALTPLLPFSNLNRYFISQRMANPSSVVAVLFGLIITWNVINKTYFQLTIGPVSFWKINISKKIIRETSIVWLSLMLSLLLFIIFFSTTSVIFQSSIYILFFSVIIFTFALLVSVTKSRFEYEAKRDAIADTIFRTLERNKVINPGITIYANEHITQEEIKSFDIQSYGIFKKIRLETVPQPQEIIMVVLSSDYKELIKIVKKQPSNSKKEK